MFKKCCVPGGRLQNGVNIKVQNNLVWAWIVWGLAAAFYFSDYLARVAPGVMHMSLQHDFGLNEAGFGIITASFYVPYIIMQIPVGLTVDRISIRCILTIMSLITALGCSVFGFADNLFIAAIGRMLIGFSAAFAFISALRLGAAWFPPVMLGLLAGLTQALGMLGAAAGETPIAFLLAHIGWRHSMFVLAWLFVVLAGLLYLFIKDYPDQPRQDNTVQNTLGVFESLRIVLTHKQTWMNALYAGFLFGPTAVIGEAIGPAYLQYGRGLTNHAAAFATGLIFIGWGIGGPLFGWLSDRTGCRKPWMIMSAVCGTVLIALIIFLPVLTTTMAYVLLFLFGFTNAGVAIAYVVSTEIQIGKVLGTSIAFTNMMSIFIGAFMQPIVGFMIDLVSGARAYHVESLSFTDFQAGLKLLPFCSLIALILVYNIKETYCKPLRVTEEAINMEII